MEHPVGKSERDVIIIMLYIVETFFSMGNLNLFSYHLQIFRKHLWQVWLFSFFTRKRFKKYCLSAFCKMNVCQFWGLYKIKFSWFVELWQNFTKMRFCVSTIYRCIHVWSDEWFSYCWVWENVKISAISIDICWWCIMSSKTKTFWVNVL